VAGGHADRLCRTGQHVDARGARPAAKGAGKDRSDDAPGDALCRGDDPGRACRLDRPVHIGGIDGPVNPGHPALEGVRLNCRSVRAEGERPAPPDHGTAVVQIVAGPGAAPFSGFAAGAEVLAAAAFGAVRALRWHDGRHGRGDAGFRDVEERSGQPH
jgi:hypothetical protein